MEKIDVIGKKIAGCLGCNGCQRNGGTCASPDESWCKVMLDSFRTYLGCYEMVKEGGYVFGFNAGAPGDVRSTDAVQKAYEMGRAV